MSRTKSREAHPDLFRDFTPAPVVERFSADQVRASACAARIKQAISRAIKESSLSREEIAKRMSTDLDESISASMIDQYTSEANERHNIPAYRLVSLFVVTGDVRVINAMLADTGVVAVADKYEALIRREMAKEARDRLDREINSADAQWRAGR